MIFDNETEKRIRHISLMTVQERMAPKWRRNRSKRAMANASRKRNRKPKLVRYYEPVSRCLWHWDMRRPSDPPRLVKEDAR